MENKANLQCNKLIHLESSMVMYGVNNGKNIRKLINTVHQMHSITTPYEGLFCSKFLSVNLVLHLLHI